MDALTVLRIAVLPFKTLQGGLKALLDVRIDAFVDEEAQLKYLIKDEFQGKLRVLPETFVQFYVSMALPPSSQLREPLNRALVRIIDRDDWIDLKHDIEVGEVVLTSGLGGRFPQDLVIGRVIEVDRREAELFQRAIVQAAADLDSLEIVFVITDFEPVDTSIFTPAEP